MNGEKMLMGGARLHRTAQRACTAAILLAAALFQTACLVLPARFAPGVEGRVVDAATGKGVADAIVVVRFDGRYGDVLPERQVMGHREAQTDAQGHFSVPWVITPGLAVWPAFSTEARVVSVLKEGYRCAKPVAIRPERDTRLSLEAAGDIVEQRESCRPVPSNRGEADQYMAAWRGLFPTRNLALDAERQRQITRILEARAVLGFGQNCAGPVTDLALAPDGRRAAYTTGTARSVIQLVEFSGEKASSPSLVVEDGHTPARRLAWTSAGDLALWEPVLDSRQATSTVALHRGPSDVVWKGGQRRIAPPAAPIFDGKTAVPAVHKQNELLEPADFKDEGDTRWRGRTFLLKRALDPGTGLSADTLIMVRETGSREEFQLPGEACGPSGRFGRPHYRIIADGDTGIDLRFVDGGCHAVQINLTNGDWRKLDDSTEAAECSDVGNIPATHLNTALRGYSREVQAARVEAGGDASAAYALVIAPDGSTHVESRNVEGEPLSAKVPNFPLTTPLRRIQVSLVGAAGFKSDQPSLPPPPGPDLRTLNPL
jgi:hypothetical protein